MDLGHFTGIVIGICLFLIIGLFHPVVIKAEYYWGTKCWPAFAMLGLICMIGSYIVDDFMFSTILATLGVTLFWCILELFEQKKRVEKGWFPMNPKRKH